MGVVWQPLECLSETIQTWIEDTTKTKKIVRLQINLN